MNLYDTANKIRFDKVKAEANSINKFCSYSLSSMISRMAAVGYLFDGVHCCFLVHTIQLSSSFFEFV